MSDTPISPGAGAVTIAGVAASLLLSIGPTVGVEVQGQQATVKWPSIPNGSPGRASPLLDWTFATFQVVGVFGSGGSVQIEGSNDGATWVKLSPTALVAAGFVSPLAVNEHPRYLRPNVTAGDSTTALTVTAWLT